MTRREKLTQAILMEWIAYDPATGLCTWVQQGPKHRRGVGAPAGTSKANTGYMQLQLLGVNYSVHRLAFLYMTGEWPKGEVDHLNRDRADNKWTNLRDVSGSVNRQNRSKTSYGKSGLLGVYIEKKNGKARTMIRVDGKLINLASGFDDPAQAQEIYLAAKRRLHPGCAI